MKLNVLLIVGLVVGNSLKAMQGSGQPSSVALTTIHINSTAAAQIEGREDAETRTIPDLEARIKAVKDREVQHDIDHRILQATIKNEQEKIELANANILHEASPNIIRTATSAINDLTKRIQDHNLTWNNDQAELGRLEKEKEERVYNNHLLTLDPLSRCCLKRSAPYYRTRWDRFKCCTGALAIAAIPVGLFLPVYFAFKH